MAQPDLIAQKILGTDPQVGFGESAVSPYRQRHLDTRGFEAMERARGRKEAQEAELQKTNAHFFNERIGKLAESDRMFDGLINQKTKDVVDTGTNVIRKRGGNLTGDTDFNQKFAERQALAQGTMQMKKQYEDIQKADYGDYVSKEDVVGAATRNYQKAALDANNGDTSAVSRNIKPNENSFEFFKADKFIYDKVKDIKMSEQSTDKKGYGALGEYITTTSNGYKFATKDAKGNLIPGIDKSIVNHFLNNPTNDPDTLRFRASMENAANLAIENKALNILKNDPRYKDIREDEVPEQLNKLKEQIAYGQGQEFFEGVDAIKERILKNKLTPFQESKESKDIKSGFKYNTDGDGEDVNIETSYNQTRNFNLDGKSKIDPSKNIEGAWVPEVKSLYDKKDKKVRFESPIFIDANTNKIIKNVGNKELNGIELQLRAYDPETGRLIIGDQKDVATNPKYSYEWYVSGSYNEGTTDKPRVKQVLMPYKDVKPQMKSAYGIDLDERAPSEYSDLELKSFIKKNFPDLSPEQKAQKFIDFRNQ